MEVMISDLRMFCILHFEFWHQVLGVNYNLNLILRRCSDEQSSGEIIKVNLVCVQVF